MSDTPRCRGCKRRLKHPSPSGYGPVCERRLNGTPPQRPRATSLASAPGPDQPELPYTDQLELWNPT